MCEIKITISAPELANAITALAEALNANRVHAVHGAASVSADESKPAETPEEAPAETPAAQQPAEMPAEPEKQPVKAEEAPAVRNYTLAELSKAGADLCTQGKMAPLVKLLNSFGVQALTQVPKEKYGDLALGLIELGAQL